MRNESPLGGSWKNYPLANKGNKEREDRKTTFLRERVDNRNSIREMSVQDSSDKTTPLFIHEHHTERFHSIGRRYRFDDLGTGQRRFYFVFHPHTHLLPPPQESYERQLERRWDLKVVLLRTQLRLNAPRHFSWSHFVGHWLSPVLAHYPLLLTVLCKFCLPPTDDGARKREREEARELSSMRKSKSVSN